MHNILNCELRVFGGIPTVFYIAPEAAYIAAAEADEVSCPALVEAFALEGVESLHNGESGLGCYHGAKVRVVWWLGHGDKWGCV